MVVAIDGPAGAGKSTVARALGAALGFTYLDSGAMYRATALLTLEQGGDPAIHAAALDIQLGDGISIGDRDVSAAIRTAEVSEAASRIAAIKTVRSELVSKQRDLLSSGDWVAEGRDIGTVVAPDSAVKIFLTATPEARAKRRAEELGTDWQTVLKDQTLRDAQDSSREHSPLRIADGAIEVDTSGLAVEQVVSQIIKLVDAARAAA